MAQNTTAVVTGKVTDESGKPVEAANVYLKGTRYQTTSLSDGSFELKAKEGSYTLIISYTGSKSHSQSVKLQAGQSLAIAAVTLTNATEMQEVNVKGKTASQQLRDQGFQVNAIDVKAMYNTTSDLNQILNRSTGVRIREEGGLGSNFNFSLNGFTGNQVKFFLDGIPMDNFGSSLTLNNIPANIAERIEVYKGVLPISLGTDALGGAINIVTRNNQNYLDVSYSIGSFNTHRPAISTAYTSKNGFTVRANAFYNYSDNDYKVYANVRPPAENSSDPGTLQWVRRFHDNYESATAQFEAGVVGKKYADRLLFGVIASGNEKDIQTGVTMNQVYGAIRTKSSSIIPTLKYKKTDLFVKGLDLNVYSAYNINKEKTIDTVARVYNWLGQYIDKTSATNGVGGENSRTQNERKNRDFYTNANLVYHLTDNQTIAFNYLVSDFHRTSFDVENPDVYTNRFPADLTKGVAGLAWNLDLPGKFIATAFGKLYNMKATGYHYVDQFTANERVEAVSFKYSNPGYGAASAYFINPDIQVKASYERAYRMPDNTEIFGDNVFLVENMNLKPEKSHNFNLGGRYNTTINSVHNFRAEAAFIYRLTSDYIQQFQGLNASRRQYVNKGKVRTTGGEAEVGYNFKNKFFASVNATYQNIIDKQEFEQSSGFTGGVTKNITYNFRLPNQPYFFGNANAGYNQPIKGGTLSFNYTLNFVQKYYLVYNELGAAGTNEDYIIPRQFAHNAFVSYSTANNKYNVSLECRNLTDNMLFDSFRLQKPGRSFALKLRYFISK